MNVCNMIFLVLAVLSGSLAVAFFIGGIFTFQVFNASDKKKITFSELTDAFLFGGLFTAIQQVSDNWDKSEDGRKYFYGCGVFTATGIGFTILTFI